MKRLNKDQARDSRLYMNTKRRGQFIGKFNNGVSISKIAMSFHVISVKKRP